MKTAHRCLAGSACRRADSQRQPAATRDPDCLCPACDRHYGGAIRQLPDDFAELRAALGEHGTADEGPKITSSPSPVIPISTRREALMSNIAETTARAAEVVADALNHEFGRRDTAPPVKIRDRATGCEKMSPPEPGSVANRAETRTHASAAHTVTAALALIEPNLRVLAGAPAAPHMIWVGDRPRITELTGMQLISQLADLHHQTRAELGKTKLRQRMTMPCPDCGARVYRNNGESIATCEGEHRHSFTETDYKVRAGLRLEERAWSEMSKWYLAEGYWRLDRVQTLIDNMAKDPDIEQPSAGPLILEKLQQILDDGPELDGKQIGHQRPKKRELGRSRRAAAQSQVDEDNWTWRNEKPYQRPPKRKPRPRPASTAPRIAQASRSTLIDIDTSVATVRDLVCETCNIVHAGECDR